MKVHIVIRSNSPFENDETKIIAVYSDENKAKERVMKEKQRDKYNFYQYETYDVE